MQIQGALIFFIINCNCCNQAHYLCKRWIFTSPQMFIRLLSLSRCLGLKIVVVIILYDQLFQKDIINMQLYLT